MICNFVIRELKDSQITFRLSLYLTHFSPLYSFYTPEKHQKPSGFREYWKNPVAWNGLADFLWARIFQNFKIFLTHVPYGFLHSNQGCYFIYYAQENALSRNTCALRIFAILLKSLNNRRRVFRTFSNINDRALLLKQLAAPIVNYFYRKFHYTAMTVVVKANQVKFVIWDKVLKNGPIKICERQS